MWGKITIFALELRKREKGMRFLGNIEAKTDQKGRVFLPSVFRKELQASGEERLIVRKDVHQKCLVLYPESAWDRRMEALFERADEFDEGEREAVRMFMSEVALLTLDGNGRLLIPKEFLEEAEIDASVRFIGMKDTIEIWASANVAKPKLSQEEFAAKLKAIMGRTAVQDK